MKPHTWLTTYTGREQFWQNNSVQLAHTNWQEEHSAWSQ